MVLLKKHDAFNCSFGKRSAQGVTDEVSISSWLFERRAFTIALIELSGQAEDVAEINKMIRLYHVMTKLHWPAEWTRLVRMS